MKKIITVTLVMLLALTLLAGCGGKTANPTPLSPVYANGVTPDYSSSNTPDDDQADETEAPEAGESDVPSSNVPEGYTTYTDKYISFNYPESYTELLTLYLCDTASGDSITIYNQDIDDTNSGFELNVYNELTNENFAEFYAAVIGDAENYDGISVNKSAIGGYEITVVKYFVKAEEPEAPETTEGEEGEEPEETPAEPRVGMADIYIENSGDASFKEIIISVVANDYTADTIPEGYTNFSDVVAKLTSSLKIVSAE